MKKTRHTTPQIIEKLRLADIALGKGQKVTEPSAMLLAIAAALMLPRRLRM